MKTNKCTFFGHKNTPERIRPLLHEVLADLIENNNTDMFYVGNQGSFDSMVVRELKELKKDYPHIKYSVVLAYMPVKNVKLGTDYSDTVYPDGLDDIPQKFAIDKRNRMMLDWSDTVVTYVCCSYGGASR